MSKPRPIHQPPRDLRLTPDEAEPSFSYERESFLLQREDDFEDEFHRRLATKPQSSGAHGAGASFWRPSSDGSQGPSFSSASLKGKSEGVKESKGPGTVSFTLENIESEIESLQQNGRHLGGESNNFDRQYQRHGSSVSMSSTNSRETKKKDVTKQRAADRRRKIAAQSSDVDLGHIVDEFPETPVISPPVFSEIGRVSTFDRTTSDQSTGSLLYGKTPTSGVLLGKTSSLIFPTGVDTSGGSESDIQAAKQRKINMLLDQCESARFRLKKKLILSNLDLKGSDIPLNDLCGTYLGNTLHKLSLSGNALGTVPARLVQNLPSLRTLDLSQCQLTQLPEKWHLPKLTRLNLSHNRFTEFPEEGILEGLPELQELNMFANKVSEIIIPSGSRILARLEVLDLGCNDLIHLPDDLDRLKALKTLKVNDNFLAKVPPRICEMDLNTIDVSSNPITEPPIETCERGICSMRRYYHCIRMEEQSKHRALEEVQKKIQKQRVRKERPKKPFNVGGFMKSLAKPSKPSPMASRKTTDDSNLSVRSAPPSSSDMGDSMSMTEEGVRSVSNPSPAHSSMPLRPVPDTFMEKHSISHEESMDEVSEIYGATEEKADDVVRDQITVNDTLKVIFVGMAMVGKTSMIKRLIEGEDAIIPNHDDRTIGVDIYEWDPKKDRRFEHIDSRIVFQDSALAETCGDVDVKFSVWDFAGQHVYHATHELFFSPRALYVLVWDMGATNKDTIRRKAAGDEEEGPFALSCDYDDDEDEDYLNDLAVEEETRRVERAIERDIDEKVQFWVDCIQSTVPGAAILPVASFADYFASMGGEVEAKRRCAMLKERLLKHEERRIQGIRERLQVYYNQNKADDPSAARLRNLLCSYTRPKLIFGNGDENVIRVSGTRYTGFEKLTKRIIDISTGRYQDHRTSPYPIFNGHVGARIPRMRLRVRDAVREMREEFKVVEWGYFINQLSDKGLTSVEDISDALHFLTNTGELSYFGSVMVDNPPKHAKGAHCLKKDAHDGKESEDEMDYADEEEEDMDDDQAVLSIDNTSITAPSTDDGSFSTVDDLMPNGLSQFVFLNPRWLVAAVACILRHDLDREIKETRRLAASNRGNALPRVASFYDAHLNCPVITSDDACLLWQAKRITNKAAKRAELYSNNMTITTFEFLQMLLIRFGVFVPIDLTIDKAFLGGKEYSYLADGCEGNFVPDDAQLENDGALEDSNSKAGFFFLPSLLGPCEPSDAWTYKTTDSWKITLCHSVLFPDGVPPGLMERLTANVLSAIYSVTNRKEDEVVQEYAGQTTATYDGKLSVKEILCWRTAFFIKLGMQVPTTDGTRRESVVEMFVLLADRDSHLCVGSDFMGTGMRRLIISGRGQVGDGARKIWKGGYLLVVKCIRRVMEQYGGLEYEKHAFCPECLRKRAVSEATFWDLTTIRAAVKNSEGTLRCQFGHQVDTRLVAGPVDGLSRPPKDEPIGDNSVVPVQDLLEAVVLVGLWDGKKRKVTRVGSGFIVDKKRGLIVTASHTLMNIGSDPDSPFGEDYYGLRQGKVVVGVIDKNSATASGKDVAMFRYFAKIVAKDPSLDQGLCQLDACVLQITTKMENDVGGDGEGCGDQPEMLLLNDHKALRNEQLKALKVTEKCELEDHVRILGFNQGGEGLLGPGERLNRNFDFARGYVCQRFSQGGEENLGNSLRGRFKPREEIVIICPTIGGHSGGPCVNQQGEVIGILSRADPAQDHRCYISPVSEWKPLVKMAKNKL